MAPFKIFSRIALSLVAGAALFIFAAAAVLGPYHYSFNGRIYPGVSIGGVDLSGLSPQEAAELLRQEIRYSFDGAIAFRDKGTVWIATPAELGFVLDANNSAQAAYSIGRTQLQSYGWVSQFYPMAIDLPPQFIYDERTALEYLQGLSGLIDVPTVEASLGLNGAEILLNAGQVGRELDVQLALVALRPQLQSLQDGLVDLQVDESPPVIFDASEQAEIAREILSAPLIVRDPDSNPEAPVEWVIEPETLAGMLSIERVEPEDGEAFFQVGLRNSELQAFLRGISPGLSRTPQNARFIFNDDTRQLDLLEESTTGRELLVETSAEKINRELGEGRHQISLAFDYILPPVTSQSTAEELGISELVSSQTSYFYGSSTARIQNIKVASSRYHGLLIPPGATFSMGEALGDVSLNTGFAEALIIFGDRTIKGVGGGVCQVSTTLFRTVFFGGFPVEERYSHAYRVYYYELAANGSVNTNLAGLDATVYVPLVDFKFTNDSENWLLMETYVSEQGRSLTWKFYSTSDGRTVEWSTTGLQNKVDPPKPHYEENPDLAKGVIKQVDWAVEGADVTVTRRVIRNGEEVAVDVFKTHYAPWRAVYEYGPGTELPKEAKEQGAY